MSSKTHRSRDVPTFIKSYPFFAFCGILLPPAALYLLFVHHDFSKRKRCLIASLLIIWTVILLPPYNIPEISVFPQESSMKLVSSSRFIDNQKITEISSSDAKESETETSCETVWISESGTKYHIRSDCSGMSRAHEMPLNKAVEQGYTPCKRCCK